MAARRFLPVDLSFADQGCCRGTLGTAVSLLRVVYAEALSMRVIALHIPSVRMFASSDFWRFSIFSRFSLVFDFFRKDRSFFLNALMCLG